MAVSAKAISEVEASWAKVSALGVEVVAVEFYRNIFTAAPEALQLFSFKDVPDLYNSPQLKKHGSTVIKTVGTAVAGIRDLEKLAPTLAKLGKIHHDLGKGIGPAHYDLIGTSLIATIRQALKEDFTPEVEAAWVEVYAVISQAMQAGAV
mmetsp:Transcript_5672/g.7875  ORF Transcript_5672/g.7875 Transcript_5672/m.7875 type:complete len:150 (-) Transcript_5672:157-606(-)